jgi:methylated-DNA-[protein]-cysteine S-methyltransferase
VAADGALVARAPTRAAVLRILRKQGGRAEAGEARRPASAVAMGTAFQRKVWAGLMRLPPGTTLTYGELARRLRCGSPRAVGRAAGANPLMGLIPCHRLVAADGPGGFAWGSAAKRRLARAERRDG